MKIAEAAAGQDHHHPAQGHALGPDLGGILDPGLGLAVGAAHVAGPSPSLLLVQSLVPDQNPGDVLSQSPALDLALALLDLPIPGRGLAPAPLLRTESPGLIPSPSPRLNHYPRNEIVHILDQ